MAGRSTGQDVQHVHWVRPSSATQRQLVFGRRQRCSACRRSACGSVARKPSGMRSSTGLERAPVHYNCPSARSPNGALGPALTGTWASGRHELKDCCERQETTPHALKVRREVALRACRKVGDSRDLPTERTNIYRWAHAKDTRTYEVNVSALF